LEDFAMGKLLIAVVFVILLAAIAFLLVDGGHIARWTGTSPSGTARNAEVPPTAASPPIDTTKPAQPSEPSVKTGSNSDSSVERFFANQIGNGFRSPIAIFGYCLVVVALIKAILGIRMRYEK
jgi:hypothetical protein